MIIAKCWFNFALDVPKWYFYIFFVFWFRMFSILFLRRGPNHRRELESACVHIQQTYRYNTKKCWSSFSRIGFGLRSGSSFVAGWKAKHCSCVTGREERDTANTTSVQRVKSTGRHERHMDCVRRQFFLTCFTFGDVSSELVCRVLLEFCLTVRVVMTVQCSGSTGSSAVYSRALRRADGSAATTNA